MAIIRKGDKEAEAKLKARASQERADKYDRLVKGTKPETRKETKNQAQSRRRADNQEKIKGVAGARAVTWDKTPAKDLKPGSIGPVSGSHLAIKKKADARTKGLLGSGVIKSGKVVKGGNDRLTTKLENKDK